MKRRKPKNQNKSAEFIEAVADCVTNNEIIELGFCPYCGYDLFQVSQIVGGGRFVVCSTCEKIWEVKFQYEEKSFLELENENDI